MLNETKKPKKPMVSDEIEPPESPKELNRDVDIENEWKFIPIHIPVHPVPDSTQTETSNRFTLPNIYCNPISF